MITVSKVMYRTSTLSDPTHENKHHTDMDIGKAKYCPPVSATKQPIQVSL